MAQYNIGLIYQNNMMYNKALDAYYELFNKDIEDYSVFYGSPAKKIKSRNKKDKYL